MASALTPNSCAAHISTQKDRRWLSFSPSIRHALFQQISLACKSSRTNPTVLLYLQGSPSTCTLDTAMVPLPSFFLVIALAANFVLSRKNSTVPKTRIKSLRWVHVTYLVLVGCQIAMTILELVRLALEQLGVGLLPINTIGLISVFVVLWQQRTSRTRTVLSVSYMRLSCHPSCSYTKPT